MRIVFVSAQFIPRVGGAEVNLARLMAAMRAEGHSVVLVTLRHEHGWPRREVVDGVPVTRVGGVSWRGRIRMGYGLAALVYAGAARVLWPEIRRADLVYTLGLVPLSAVAVGLARLARKPAVTCVSTAGPAPGTPWCDEKRPQSLLAGPLPPDAPFLRVPPGTYVASEIDHLRSVYPLLAGPTLATLRRGGAHVIALTTLMRDRLAAAGFAPDHITIIPNGIDAAAFATECAPAAAERPPTALCVLRHSFEKGLDIALHAWRIVHERLPEARLVVLGAGPLRLRFEALASALGLGESAELRGASRAVATARAQADCFVMPSRWEGFPIVLLEAAASGLPTVAADVSGARDLIEDGRTGFVVPVGDYELMAERILTLLTDREAARQMGAGAARTARERFTQRQAIDRLLALCARLGVPASPAGAAL